MINNPVTPIEHQNQRILTTQQLAEFYGTDTDKIKQNFNNNKARYQEGKHYYLIQGNDLKEFLQVEIFDLQNKSKIRQLYLWTEKGAFLHAKSLNTEVAWEVYDRLVETYFRAVDNLSTAIPEPVDNSKLSPQLQALLNITQGLVSIELKQTEMAKQIEATNQRIDSIKEIVALTPTQWRKTTSELINKMAVKAGGYDHINFIRNQSYVILEQRFGVQLKTRLTNKRKTLAINGATKSKIDKTNNLDIIAEDKKLIEGYVAIIKEMAIKYGVDVLPANEVKIV